MYEVRLRSRRVQRELDVLTESDYQRVLTHLKALGGNPRPPGCEKLLDDIYRIRVGDYRVIYLVDDAASLVQLGAVRRRDERTYQGLEELFR